MADYHSLLMRAVGNLPSAGTPATRQAIYSRARKALLEQLRSLRPPLPESDIRAKKRRSTRRSPRSRRTLRARRGRPVRSALAGGKVVQPAVGGQDHHRRGVAFAEARDAECSATARCFPTPPCARGVELPLHAGRSHCVRGLAARPVSDGAARPAGAIAKRACPIRRSAAAFAKSAGSRSARAERNPSTPNSARRQARRRRPSGRRLQSASTAACLSPQPRNRRSRPWRRRPPVRPRPWSRRRTPRRKDHRRPRRPT